MKKDLALAKELWERLGDIPTNEEEELDEDFGIPELGMGFETGVDMYEVWHWFEETFNISVAKDLMNLD